MTKDDSGDDGSNRRYKWRYGPLRLVMPWLAGIGGILGIFRGVAEVQAGGSPLFIFVGAGLVVMAIVFFFVYRWQAKRGY